MRRQALFLLMILMCCIGMSARKAGAQQPETNIAAELLVEGSPAPGTRTMIAVRFTPKPGWHGYWKNPGDAGQSFEMKGLPLQVQAAGDLRYPVPEKLLIAGLMNHVFKGEHVLLLPVKIANDARPGSTIPLNLAARWLACTDRICVPEEAVLNARLTVGRADAAPARDPRFDTWRAELPFVIAEAGRFERAKDVLRIAIPLPASTDTQNAWFYSETIDAINYSAAQSISRKNDWLIVEAKASDMATQHQRISGLLATPDGRGFEFHARPGPVPRTVGSAGIETLLAFGGALLGGLLLNILPCVFPIISLKALSLARAGENEAAARADALAYTTGVVLTCLALGGVLLSLRAAGVAVGWAFQLQNPWVVAALLLLALAITANLAGLFTLRAFGGGQALAGQGGAQGAFWTGVLAAFVATPCTGPFMAAALGAALVLPTGAALLIFAGLGFGMAIPFLAIGFVPALRSKMPRPGPWMETFRKAMTVPMALTAMALGWLLVQQLSPKTPAAEQASYQARGIEVFSETRLAALRAAGKPVFLYFTADWCVTCKVNEKTALETDATRAHFRQKGIVVMVGDWSDGNTAITRFLDSQGRTGIPLYLFYPKAGEAQELPQLLTIAALKKL